MVQSRAADESNKQLCSGNFQTGTHSTPLAGCPPSCFAPCPFKRYMQQPAGCLVLNRHSSTLPVGCPPSRSAPCPSQPCPLLNAHSPPCTNVIHQQQKMLDESLSLTSSILAATVKADITQKGGCKSATRDLYSTLQNSSCTSACSKVDRG
eukprot:1155968-Pelagomonas_calceolata.AAC.8